jgi:2-keto-4-pentenoate hydratase/2-oxohepta-3-ene-1,7-dioic acid hydratase in catechol pathway
MKLLNFEKGRGNGNEWALGIKIDQGVLDVQAALGALGAKGIVTAELKLDSIHDIIGGGQAALEALRHIVDCVNDDKGILAECLLDENSLTIGPCVTHPNKMICVGLNYRKHAEETNSPIPDYPILFNKFNNALNGHGHDVYLPKVSTKVDYEAELVIVIGTTGKYVDKDNALKHVFGYCNGNDISARDLQRRTQQWLLGKSCDGFGPIGPYLVTADEVGNPNALDIQCVVNGEVRQHSTTADMIFQVDEIVSYTSQHMTLVPGDLIFTGTPAGVVAGYPKDEQVYLQHGDQVTIEIEKLGSLTNQMVGEAK